MHRTIRSTPLLLTAFLVSHGFAAAAPAGSPPADLATARGLLLRGRYEESRLAFEKLAKQNPVAAALGAARCRSAVGDVEGAVQALLPVAKSQASAEAHGELARLEFGRGRYDAVRAHVDAALKIDSKAPAARFYDAELHRVQGRLDQATEAYGRLIRYYNTEQDSLRDPEVFRWIGLAGGQYARWNRNSGQFDFLVNTLYPDALKLDPSTGRPISRPRACSSRSTTVATRRRTWTPRPSDQSTRRRGPRGACAGSRSSSSISTPRAPRSTRALAINPRLVGPVRLKADRRDGARRTARRDRRFSRAPATLNPADEETLGRLAAVYGAIDGLRDDHGGHPHGSQVIAEAVRRNAHCGIVLRGALADEPRPAAEVSARRPLLRGVAASACRSSSTSPGQLGLVYMRLGDEAKARQLLEESLRARSVQRPRSNTLKVLEVLDGYGTSRDRALRHAVRSRPGRAARAATPPAPGGRVYPEVVEEARLRAARQVAVRDLQQRQGHQRTRLVQHPHGRAAVHRHGGSLRGQDGGDHVAQRRARRSVQLGARAQARVRARREPAADRLQHSALVHRGARRASRGRGPSPRSGIRCSPSAWRPTGSSIWRRSTIGFVRPSSGEDWTLAYCQAELYARYMADTYGEEGLAKMIAAYADNLDTPERAQAQLRSHRGGVREGLPPLCRASRRRERAPRRPEVHSGRGRAGAGARGGEEPEGRGALAGSRGRTGARAVPIRRGPPHSRRSRSTPSSRARRSWWRASRCSKAAGRGPSRRCAPRSIPRSRSSRRWRCSSTSRWTPRITRRWSA